MRFSHYKALSSEETEELYMQEILLSLLAGLICGAIFTALKLPLPAPPVLPGVVGIFGVFLGMKVYQFVVANWPF
jgi:XapX domain-containing protein